MSKITNKQIQSKVEQLQADGFDIAINFQGSPARGKITTKDESRDISDRMVSTDLDMFLQGYIEGHRAGVYSEKTSQKEVLELKS
jgi:hypothetical protein